ncbi:hypothetical protein LCGC14_2164340, partial [marine sediment metagenome]
ELNKMGYKIICCGCSKYMSPESFRIKDSFILQCPKCGNSTFKIEIINGSHHENTTYKITCVRCNEYLSLNYSKVKNPLFRFIQCPICEGFEFKIEIVKKNITGHVRTGTLNARTQKLYDDEYERKRNKKIKDYGN